MIDRTIVEVAAEPDIHAICSDAVTQYATDMDNLYAAANTGGQQAVADFADALAAEAAQANASAGFGGISGFGSGGVGRQVGNVPVVREER